LAWIGYELYGRTALEWLSGSSSYVRIAGGIVVIGYLYWQLNSKPEEFNETLDLAKQLLTHQGLPSSTATKEKRNVSGLLKKKIAASQEWKCGSCKSLLDETYEVDHKLALFQGGTNEPENLVALCPNCHRHKTVEERLK
jgi:predicted HNH restriction endonuclease